MRAPVTSRSALPVAISWLKWTRRRTACCPNSTGDDHGEVENGSNGEAERQQWARGRADREDEGGARLHLSGVGIRRAAGSRLRGDVQPDLRARPRRGQARVGEGARVRRDRPARISWRRARRTRGPHAARYPVRSHARRDLRGARDLPDPRRRTDVSPRAERADGGEDGWREVASAPSF